MCAISKEHIQQTENIVINQISANFLSPSVHEVAQIHQYLPKAFKKIEFCFAKISNKYYYDESEVRYNPFHTGHYTMLLYWLAHLLYRESTNNVVLCDKLYYISKMISSADLYYDIDLPDIFFFDHPQGSVMGRAAYSNYFSFLQGCTVGNNHGIYPTLGSHVYMMSNSKILGNCKIGNNVVLAANSMIIDMDVPDNSIVYGCIPNVKIKLASEEKIIELTKNIFKR